MSCMRGGGAVSSQQFFNPNVLPPMTIFPAPSSAPTYTELRPVLSSTFQSGAGRGKTRRSHRGGFAPSIMGSFVANAQAAIVPLALYAVYHTMVPKVNEIKKNVLGGVVSKAVRKATRKYRNATRKYRKDRKSRKDRK